VNESPRCAVMMEAIVSGFKIAAKVQEFLLAKWRGDDIGLHHSLVASIGCVD